MAWFRLMVLVQLASKAHLICTWLRKAQVWFEPEIWSRITLKLAKDGPVWAQESKANFFAQENLQRLFFLEKSDRMGTTAQKVGDEKQLEWNQSLWTWPRFSDAVKLQTIPDIYFSEGFSWKETAAVAASIQGKNFNKNLSRLFSF